MFLGENRKKQIRMAILGLIAAIGVGGTLRSVYISGAEEAVVCLLLVFVAIHDFTVEAHTV